MADRDRAIRVESAVRSHSAVLLAYFARRVDPPGEAADLLAETLLILWRRASALPQKDDEVRPWMFGIGRHVLLHHYRTATRQHAITDRLRSILSATPHAGFADPTEHDDLHQALARLDQIDREIIGLIHWDGFSLVEVSRVLVMKEGTVRSRYHRARASLRQQLQLDNRPAESYPRRRP